MPEEDTGIDQAQEEIDQDAGETQDEEVAITEGFPGSDTEEETSGDVEDDTGKASEKTPAGEEGTKKAKEDPTVEYLNNEIAELRKHNTDLNRAISQFRAQSKEAKAEEESPLTDAQLRQLYKEHKDDPDTLFNIVEYQIKQGAKKAGQETFDAAEMSKRKLAADNYITQNWPDLNNDASPLRHQVDQMKQAADLNNHPMGDVMGLALLILNNLPTLNDGVFEAGKQAGLGEKADGKRKKKIEDTKISPSGKGGGKKGEGNILSGSALETAKQMDMNPAQKKIYARLIGKKAQIMEAS